MKKILILNLLGYMYLGLLYISILYKKYESAIIFGLIALAFFGVATVRNFKRRKK